MNNDLWILYLEDGKMKSCEYHYDKNKYSNREYLGLICEYNKDTIIKNYNKRNNND